MSDPVHFALTGDVEGDGSPKYTCAFCGGKVHLFDAIGMVVHSLKECRERMRAERDAVKQERDAAESAIRYAYAKLTPDLTTTRISEAISALSQALVIINDRKPA